MLVHESDTTKNITLTLRRGVIEECSFEGGNPGLEVGVEGIAGKLGLKVNFERWALRHGVRDVRESGDRSR